MTNIHEVVNDLVAILWAHGFCASDEQREITELFLEYFKND